MKNFSKRKMKKEIQNFPKLLNVVMSCNTKDQCKSGMKYVTLYRNAFHNKNSVLDSAYELIEQRLLMYLQDTSQHDEMNYHNSQVFEYNVIDTWPNINDYLDDLFNVKFKQVWVRGTKPIIC